jgi:[protein-PII] uridylyltransferase
MTVQNLTSTAPPAAMSLDLARSELARAASAAGDEIARRSGVVRILKQFHDGGRALVEARLKLSGKGLECATSLSVLQDQVIELLYDVTRRHFYRAQNPSTSERISIVAVGGYGRGTLAPGSDIDLLFLLPYKQTAWGESIAEFMLYVLWDLRLKVGHAARSIDDCMRLARNDDTILTALLEARFICGDRALFDDMSIRFRKEVISGGAKEFIAVKLAERDARHFKAGQSRYLVEPDVKDGVGGLRDLHTLFWIARYVYGSSSVRDLGAKNVFTSEEVTRFVRCEDFLWAVRCNLHFMTGKNSDRLSFEFQAELAERLGYTAHAGLKHVERFMKHYFLIAKEVGDLTRIFCAVLEAQEMKKSPGMVEFWRGITGKSKAAPIPSNDNFRIDSGRMNVSHEGVFESSPVNILRLFAYADEYRTGIHPDALKLVRRSLPLVGTRLRDEPEANRLFLNLLTESHDPETTLRRLNEAGVLGRFIPDFGKIVALMQFNMYHHYTVDEHLIRAVGILSEIERGTLKEDHPVASDIVHTLSLRRALYVAVLLHDVAKGRSEHHSVAGERLARSLGPRLGLAPAETETVAWLVRHHLLMSETAQMRDLNDYKTILDFAKIVQSPERLKLLLILTVVDIRAVGPGVWNGWKGQLLRTLYWEAEPILSGGHTAISRKIRVAESQSKFLSHFPHWDDAQKQTYIQRHYDPYWLTADQDHQFRHAKLILEALRQGQTIATHVATDEFTAITELTVYAPDHPRLLALLTGACAASGANIVGAQIFTTTDGMALDTILIQREFPDASDEKRRGDRVADLVRQALRGELRLREKVAALPKTKGRLKAFNVVPQVIIDNDSSNRYTVVEVAGLDRTGLLFHLTEALSSLNLNIVSAHIATFGERAVDVFYVTDLTGAKITSDSRVKKIIVELTRVLSSD